MNKSLEKLVFALALLFLSGGLASPQQQLGRPSVSLLQPRKSGQLDCPPDAGAITRCAVGGGATGISQGQKLLLWVRPVNPPSESDGWYLQRPPNGVGNLTGNTWTGKIQIGNRDFPAHDGDTVDVAVSIADAATADRLIRTQGVAIETEPVGAVTAISENVRLHVPKRR
jgi:type II secretory pathway pseudopilin PulG